MTDYQRQTRLLSCVAALVGLTLSGTRLVLGQSGSSQATSTVGPLLNQAKRVADAHKVTLSLSLYEQARSRAQKRGDASGQAKALKGLGDLYADTSQPQKALECYQKSLALDRAHGNKQLEVVVLDHIARTYADTGQPQKALEFYEQRLALYRSIQGRHGEVNTLTKIGCIYLDMDQPKVAMEVFKTVLQTARPRQDRSELDESPIRTALEYLQQRVKFHRARGATGREASVLNNIGRLSSELGWSEKALEAHLQALRLLRTTSEKLREADTLNSIAAVYKDIGQQQKALDFYQQAGEVARVSGNRQREIVALTGIGTIELARNELSSAARSFDQAIALSEQVRENLGGLSEAKSSYLQSKLALYYSALQTHLQLQHEERAFVIAQKTKARSLLDLMASGRVELSSALTPEERKAETDLRQKADALNTQMVQEGVANEVGAKERFAALGAQLKEVESQLHTLTDTLYARHPNLAQKRVATTATLEDIAKLLPPDTALLDYIVLSKDKLVLFLVAGSKLTVQAIALDYPSLVKKASALREACADPRKDVTSAAQELYTLLLAPVKQQLLSAKRLVVCPDGALWDVPFQVLRSEGKFLAERYEVVYAYSATGAQAALSEKVGRKKPTQALLTVANPDFGSSKRFGDLDHVPGQRPIASPDRPIKSPDRPIDAPSRAFDSVSRGGRIVALPGTQREAEALKTLFSSATLLTGKSAQESSAKQLASQFRYLHFATHGFFNDASPLLSSLVLAAPVSPGSSLATPNNGGKPGSSLATPPPNPPSLGVAVSAAGGNTSAAGGKTEDGFLTARELFDLDLSAEMVVLSACNTARGVERTGDGVIGLTWALFVAGCPTQVVSQWSVDDASTATLMEAFYKNLSKGKGAALRQASLSLMQDPKHRHPYYWAPFVLIGDWR